VLPIARDARFDDAFEIHREEGSIAGHLGNRGLDVGERCVSPKRDSVLVSQLKAIVFPWDSGVGRAEVARRALWLELQVQRLRGDNEIVLRKDARRVVFWRDDEWAVVLELPVETGATAVWWIGLRQFENALPTLSQFTNIATVVAFLNYQALFLIFLF
jgi:hypothetical protein